MKPHPQSPIPPGLLLAAAVHDRTARELIRLVKWIVIAGTMLILQLSG